MLKRLIHFIQCLRVGHKYYNSRQKRGYMTCSRCGHRRRYA